MSSNFDETMEGSYSCSATLNTVPTASEDTSITLLDTYFDASDIYLVSGSPLTLSCGADSPTQLSYVPSLDWSDG